MRVLLTGSTGFIGSHLLEKLIDLSIPTAILIRKESIVARIKELLTHATVIYADLGDLTPVEETILHFKPDHLLHLAWSGIENRFHNDYDQISQNLVHLTNLMQLAEKCNIKKIIGFGSQAEYGPQTSAIAETMPECPTTLYGASKLAAYQILKVFCQLKNIDFVWIRLFSIYGPKDNNSWFIPSLIRQILNKNEPSLTEGKQLWDFIYISDVIDAIISILQTPESKGLFNLGSGKSLPIKKVAEQIRDIINPTIKLHFGRIPYRPDQVMNLKADVKKLSVTTGWSPKVDLQKGLEHTISWCTEEIPF